MSPRPIPTVRLLARLAREAGRIALAHQRRPEVTRKADHTIVTQADRVIEALLADRIVTAFPDHAILGEEGARRGGDGEVLWVIDPIDGTSAYARGLPFFAVSIGVLRHGRPWLGVVHMPALRRTFLARAGRGARDGDRRLPPLVDPRPFGTESLLLVPSNAHRRYLIDFPGKGRSLGSAAAQVCLVAAGSAEGTLVRGAIWDVAAAALIVTECGGALRYLSGRPFDWDALVTGAPFPEPLLVAHPAALDELGQRIARKPTPQPSH